MLGELALRDQYLATPAKTAAAAHRVDVHAETARRLQQRRADRKIAALAGGREYDEWISSGHANRRIFRPGAGDDRLRGGPAELRRARRWRSRRRRAGPRRESGEYNERQRGRVPA